MTSTHANDATLVQAGLRPELCRAVAGRHPYPLLFATVSGAHLYGFPSPDSDYDLRGVHLLPLPEVVGLSEPQETLQSEGIEQGVEIDLVTHDAAKFFRLMLRRNGYVLEQLFSPLVVQSTAAHAEMISLAQGCLTRNHAYHYLGFAETQWHLFAKESPPRVKPLLYLYRVLLTGIELMRSGRIEADIRILNATHNIRCIDELISVKTGGHEQQTIDAADVSFHRAEYERLRQVIENEQSRSSLPEAPSVEARKGLNDLLVKLRIQGHHGNS